MKKFNSFNKYSDKYNSKINTCKDADCSYDASQYNGNHKSYCRGNFMDIVRHYIAIHDRSSDAYKYVECSTSDYFYVRLRRKIIYRCTKTYLKSKYDNGGSFMKTYRHGPYLIVIDKTDWFQPQSFPHIEWLLGTLFDKTKDLGSKLISLFASLKRYTQGVGNAFGFLGKIDWAKLGDLIISIFFSATTALHGIYGVLQFLYNLFKFTTFISSTLQSNAETSASSTGEADDVTDESSEHSYFEAFEPQTMSLEALMAGFSLLGLPSSLMDKIRNFALLTGVKVHASHSFSSLFSKIRDIIVSVLDYIFSLEALSSFRPMAEHLKEIVDYLFTPFRYYDDILKVSEQYTQFIRDNSVLHNPVFRNEVQLLYDRLKVDNGFLDYIKNNDNRHFTAVWGAYEGNLVKFINTYSTSSRKEPICIVFDGPPGCGKSVLMNRFVEMLRAHNKSVYTHTVPSAETSKDFYDDYMNQDVFVMDDVGQQGKSQWRTIINFVSPVKYPLDCAQAEKKNTKFFQSEVILCTTNNFRHLGGFTSKDGISCPEALFRRVHLISVDRNRNTTYFSQRLRYSKYSESSNEWKRSFLGPCAVPTRFCPNLSDFPLSLETPRGKSTETALSWLFLLYNHIVEAANGDRELTENDIDHASNIERIVSNPLECLTELNRYKPQLFDALYEAMTTAWNGVLHGSEIFREYVNYLTRYVEDFLKELMSKMFLRIVSPMWNAIITINSNTIGQDMKMLLGGIFTFIKRLVCGDFIEERHDDVPLDMCFLCFDNMREAVELSGERVPVTVLSCGHIMCASCTVLREEFMRNNPNTPNTCGYCRAESLTTQSAYYMGDNRVSYEAVRNYVKEGLHYGKIASKRLINKLVSSYVSAIRPFTPFTLNMSVLFLYFCITGLRNLFCFQRPQSKEQGFFSWLFGNRNGVDITHAQFEESRVRANSLVNGLKFNETSAKSFKKNHCRIVVNTTTLVHTCVIVSGKRFLTNSHFEPGESIVDVYQSYEHMREGHKEMESVKVKVINNYMASDVCVCEFVDIVPFYKLFNRFGGIHEDKFSPNMFVSPYGIIPLIPGVSIRKNDHRITYKYRTREGTRVVDHSENSGLLYEVQGAGLCGSVVYSNDRVVGMHSTGNGKEGFAQIFPEWLCQELNESMNSRPVSGNFEVRDKIEPNFSGVRLSYGNDIKWQNHGATSVGTSFLPSHLHMSNNESTKAMYTVIRELQNDGAIAPTEIEAKQPPIFGNTRAEVKENMLRLSKKSFKHQGVISQDEMSYIGECIRSILPPQIRDLSDEETCFGGDNVKGFKKDTSNGFACEKDKAAYIDFNARTLTDAGRAVLDKFRANANNKAYCEDDFVCRETFKDELRTSAKANAPRLFRVMPFPHIWWTKKLLGQLVPWFKEHLHEFGVCVGFNPYKDFDTMVSRLKTKDIHGDEDYSKWDGSLLALIVLVIRDELMRIYKGENGDVLDYVMVTLARPWTLIADELYATTHSIPSGTWVTLILNCLVNKALVALTIYRNKANPTVQDFLDVISYVCGDDKIFGSDAGSNYDLHTVKNTAESLGMTVTNGDKTPIDSPSRDLMDLNFLKRNILYHPILNRYVGALSISTLFNTIQWYNIDKVGESLTYEDLMRDKCNAVLVEAFLHSRNCFLSFRDYMRRNGVDGLFTEERVLKILSDDDGYEVVLDLFKKNYFN